MEFPPAENKGRSMYFGVSGVLSPLPTPYNEKATSAKPELHPWLET